MALVDYSSSDSEDEESKFTAPQTALRPRPQGGAGHKRKRDDGPRHHQALPALPASMHDLYATAARTSMRDDPLLHGGRKRAVPHMDDHWPTHVYLEWFPSPAERAKLNSILQEVKNKLFPNVLPGLPKAREIHSLVESELETPLPLHISLSAPLLLRTDQRDDFTEALQRSISKIPGLSPFQVSIGGLDWASNESSTRWFLVLRPLRPPKNQLNQLLYACNRAAKSLGQPLLYEKTEPEVHASRTTKKTEAGQNKGRRFDRSPRRRSRALAETANANGNVPDYTDRLHFSIGWTLHKPSSLGSGGRDTGEGESKSIEQADTVGKEPIEKVLQGTQVQFQTVRLKIGNTIKSIDLAAGPYDGASKSILG